MFSVEFGKIYRIFLISSVSELFGNSSRINFFRVRPVFPFGPSITIRLTTYAVGHPRPPILMIQPFFFFFFFFFSVIIRCKLNRALSQIITEGSICFVKVAQKNHKVNNRLRNLNISLPRYLIIVFAQTRHAFKIHSFYLKVMYL